MDTLESTEELEEQKETNQEPPKDTASEKSAEVSTDTPPEVSTEPTFDETQQAYIDRLLSEAREASLRAGQSSKDRELQPLKDTIDELKRKAREADLAAIEKSIAEKFGDSPESKDLAVAYRKLEEEKDAYENQRAKDREFIEYVEAESRKVMAFKLAQQYPGTDEKELLKAKSPEEMQTMARDAHIAFLKSGVTKTKAKKVASSVSTAPGTSDFSRISFDPNAPSAREMISRGVNKSKE
jgi:hypothetical protein